MAIEWIVPISRQEWLSSRYALTVDEVRKAASEVRQIFDSLVCDGADVRDWKLHYLSNGGTYMAPAATSSNESVVMVTPVAGKRELSPDAAGIVASLYFFSKRSPRLYKLLFIYAMGHPDTEDIWTLTRPSS